MNTNNTQYEMQQIIEDCINCYSYTIAQECLAIYQNTFGYDKFCLSCELDIVSHTGPLVSLIVIQSNKTDVNTFLSNQTYKNLDIFYVSSDNLENDINTYIASVESKYICFYEPFYKYDPYKVAYMVFFAEHQPDLDALICDRNFIDASGTIIAHPDYVYQENVNGKVYYGQQLIEASIVNNINFYGSLSTLLLSAQYIRQLHLVPLHTPSPIRTLSLLYQLLLCAKTGFINRTLVSSVLQPYKDSSAINAELKHFIHTLYLEGKLRHTITDKYTSHTVSHSIQHEITFFYTDNTEYYNLKPIADEAAKRGYHIIFTQDLEQKAEIGIYCQHLCFIRHPEYSKFSVILLHDIGQGERNWPNHWEAERWHKFDIGILPGKFWADLWAQCACQYYANPRYGVFELGYPKSDLVASGAFQDRTEELRRQLHLKYDKSVLYAPSWENNGKEDDFVTALSTLKVNLLIKQAPNLDQYPDIKKNARLMRTLHEGKYDNIYYMDSEENIMPILALCDIVVSDESGVMSEAVMFGKPSIAVMDWLIPDVTPYRFSCVPIDYVDKCEKVKLRGHVEMLLNSSEYRNKILAKGKQVFSNIGNCCSDILDAIAYYTSENPPKSTDFQNKRLTSRYTECSLWN